MPTIDPIADMLTRIRNGLMIRKAFVLVPSSKIKVGIAQILLEEGFIQGYEVTSEQPQPNIRVWLKYDERRRPILTGMERASKPGRRVYKGKKDLPWVLSGLGVAIVSTPKGLMTDREARRQGVGGEILCYVW
ncbi:MAG: 30S ribosomal protein S8 [Anaerolineaceae bacterium]|nr:30S ribosomal protein S8 [Anaerolineae bacterium]MDX9831688.1 30S ribosomal protein S8 [Anaerolineae bacterium]NLF14109.1 30S ribosomal protein S8 [Anaerolineaceae bacterium]